MENRPFVTAAQVASCIQAEVVGNSDERIYGIALLRDSTPEYLTYMNLHQLRKDIEAVKARVILIPPAIALPRNRTFIMTGRAIPEVLDSVTELMIEQGMYERHTAKPPLIAESADIAESAVIGNGSIIGADAVIQGGVVIGENVKIGRSSIIKANSVICSGTIIGNHTSIGCGSVIGDDSFEYAQTMEGWKKIRNVGHVEIGDDVIIGANVTIDRGTIGVTRIGNATQIGNLVQIAHEVRIGAHCHIVSHTAFAGWCEIGDYVDVYGQAAFANHVKVGNHAVVYARAGVTKDIPEYGSVSGYPAISHMKHMKMQARLRKLLSDERS